MRPNTEQDFWGKVLKTDSCWLWQGSLTHRGYGQASYKNKNVRAHRLAYQFAKGEIPAGMLVCHTCDNPQCCNPDHLFIGTSKDNSDDMIKKGRARATRGRQRPLAKLSENSVRRIRIVGNAISQRKIAKAIGVTQTVIGDVLLGRAWKHIK